MKRLLTTAAAAAALVAGTGSEAQAQARASLFDLGIYAGGAYHWNWLEDVRANDYDRLNPGFAPAFGANATFYATPTFGIRTNVTYSPIELPDEAAPDDVNGWLYDLSLVLRPWIEREDLSPLMSSMYLFLGGGGFTANPPGDGGCVTPYGVRDAACLPLESDRASVGQGTAGIGFDVVSLANNIGFFTELALNGYDSPFHTGPGWTGQPDNERDTFGWSGRLVAGLKFAFGNLIPVVVPPPVTPPPPPPPPAPAPPATREITVCVLENGRLREVNATFNPATGDTMVNNRPFATAYPATAPGYAANANWYINNDSITIDGRQYVRFGVARVITPPNQLERVEDFRDVPVFAQTGEEEPQQVLYVPLRPGCEFQPYQLRERIRVRG